MSFVQTVLQQFNTTHNSLFNNEEFLFGLSTVSDVLQKKIELHSTVFALLHYKTKSPEWFITDPWFYLKK